MHPYSTDSNERRNMLVYLAFISLICAYSLNWFVTEQQLPFQIAMFIGILSPLTLFYSVYQIFDTIVWEWMIWRTIRWVRVPNLNGDWEGIIHSSYQGHEIPIKVSIRQTWTRISVRLRTGESESHSVMASLEADSLEGIVLSYQYVNEPKAMVLDTMSTHRGAVRLKMSQDQLKLEGGYFTNRRHETSNYGDMKITRISR